MRILMLCDFYDNKQQYQENLLSKYYQLMGNSIVIITSTYEDIFDYVSNHYDISKKQSIVVENNVKIYRLPYSFNILHKLKRFSGIYEILLNEKPDLIFLHGISFNLNDAVKYKKVNTSCRLIMDYHADYSNSGKNWFSINILHKLIRKPFLTKYLKYISEIYPIVPGSKIFLREVYGIKDERMEILPLGCDTLLANKVRDETDKDKLKNSLNISPDSFIIITGGKLNSLKKTDILIDAVKHCNSKNNIELIIFGIAENKEFEMLLNEIAGNAINIHFLGWKSAEEILKLMYISDIAIFPGSQSVLWQQSIGMYLPLIVGNSGDQNAEYLNKKNNLIQLTGNEISVSHFVEIIEELSQNPKKLKEMREGAEYTAQYFLDYEIICKKTLK